MYRYVKFGQVLQMGDSRVADACAGNVDDCQFGQSSQPLQVLIADFLPASQVGDVATETVRSAIPRRR